MHAFDDLRFEQSAVVEKLLHRHVGDYATSLAFDDAFDNVLDMVAAGANNARVGAIAAACEKSRIFDQALHGIVRADCKDCRERELQLLRGHGLETKAEVTVVVVRSGPIQNERESREMLTTARLRGA